MPVISRKIWTACFVLTVGMFGGTISAVAQDDSELLASTTAEWWQNVNSIPSAVNPLIDPTGASCMVGQRDPIWFLTGSFSGGTAIRTCTLPAGEALFFPVINNVFFNTPNVCGQGASLDVPTMRGLIEPFIDAATNMSVNVDGKSVKNLIRIKSEVFAITLPADNIWNALCGGPGTVPAGVYSPSVDDGYYVLLGPLRVGSHTLHIHAESSGGFLLDVTYLLTVAPVQLK